MDEFEETGLTPTPAHRLEGVPRVAESPLHLECQLHDTMEVGDGSYGASTPVMCSGAARVECDSACVWRSLLLPGTMVVGNVVHVGIAPECYDEATGRIRSEQLQTVSRLGGMDYGDAVVRATVRDDTVWSEDHW